MPPGEGGSTPGNIVAGDVRRRPRRRLVLRRSTERIHPGNLKFDRKVAAVQAKQKQQQDQLAAAAMGSMSFTVSFPCLKIWPDDHLEDGENRWNCDIHGTSTPLLLEDSTQEGEGQLLKDLAKPLDDRDFLEGTFIKINSDKQKATTRNKKNSKKQKKKKKSKGKGRKQFSHASEMKNETPTEPSSTCAAATGGKTLASLSSRVAEYSSSSSSSQVTAKLIITSTPAVNNVSSGKNEKELSASSSNDDFKSFKSTTSYATAASSSGNEYYTGTWNSTMGDYAGSLSSDARSERSLSASDSTDSRGYKKTSDEGNEPPVHQSFSSAFGHGCSQEALLCPDYASNDGDFQKVVSKKSAQKIKKMQRLESPPPSSTMASSVPVITSELVPRAPFTIGDYLNNDTFYGRKPNQKRSRYQKARSLSNLSKTSTGYTDGDNVSVSNGMFVIKTAVQPAKPKSSHHVTLEAIEEMAPNSPRCLPKEGELKATAPVGDGIQDTNSKAPPSDDKSSSLGILANSSCANREQQKKVVALAGGDTEDIRAPSSDYPSSLGHLGKSSYVDREEQKIAVALVGEGSENINSRIPTSDKTSSLGQLVNSSCVDKEEQKRAMSPVGGDTEDADSRAPTCDKTLSPCHLAISSSADSEEQKKEENRIAFSTRASCELDKIIKAANNAYRIQEASDVYMTSGIHADIENFLHAATPAIRQISCTKSTVSLQDQRLWSLWSWYEEPECCGIEVEMKGKTNSIWPEFSTYFQPLLSAVQLFGQSGKSQNLGELIFEYFELENPYSRPPIFTKIKQLRDGVNLSRNPIIFGNPKQLESAKLSDLHPSSWYSVAWYPICQIPAAAGSCQASFLTYHSLGKLVPQSTDKPDARDSIICPIVGLLGYKDQGGEWFQLREQLRFKPITSNVSSVTGHAELLNKRLRTLRHAELLNKRLRTLRQGASIMSKAVVPRPFGETMNYHSDFEFFWSRSL